MKQLCSALTLIAVVALAWFAWQKFVPPTGLTGMMEHEMTKATTPAVASGQALTELGVPAQKQTPAQSSGTGAVYNDETLLAGTTQAGLAELRAGTNLGLGPKPEGSVAEPETETSDRLDQSLALLARLDRLRLGE